MDTVTDWSRYALALITEAEPDPVRASRAMRIVHVAMFEALNFNAPRYPSQMIVVPAAAARLPPAAVAASAAHSVLAHFYEAHAPRLDVLLDRSLEQVEGGRSKAGVIQGRAIAINVVALYPEDPGGWPAPAAAAGDALEHALSLATFWAAGTALPSVTVRR